MTSSIPKQFGGKMAEEKVKVNLFKPVTFKGVDYQTGEVDFPADGSANIVRKKLGEYVAATKSILVVEEEFEPLSREETWEKFTSGDDSDIVFKSLKFHQAAMVKERRKHDEELEKRRPGRESENSNSQTSGENRQSETETDEESEKTEETKEQSETETENNSATTSEGIPANFPMRHIFVKLGFKSVAEIQAKTRDELIALNGVAETTADKALAFGKN